MWGYSARQVANLLGLSVERVRSYVHAGFLSARRGSRGEFRFSFQDLVLLKTARGLLDAQVPARRVRRALRKLREQLPEGKSLAQVHIAAQGDEVVVRNEGAMWQAESGQVLFDFGVSDLAKSVAPLVRKPDPKLTKLTAEDWFGWGCDLEDGAPQPALEAYQRALQLDPDHADAAINLGRLLHNRGELERAEELYRRAEKLRPDDATPSFNLGVLLEDLGRLSEAQEAYRRALSTDSGCADAHFNLARLCEAQGQHAAAFKHLASYRKLVRQKR